MSAQPSARAARRPRPVRRSGGGGGALFDLLYLISVTEFKRTYFGTALGYLWSLGRPLMLFGGPARRSSRRSSSSAAQVPHYPVLLLFNIVLFGFFQEATAQAVTSIVSQEGIVRKTQFPRLVIPLVGRAHRRSSTSA